SWFPLPLPLPLSASTAPLTPPFLRHPPSSDPPHPPLQLVDPPPPFQPHPPETRPEALGGSLGRIVEHAGHRHRGRPQLAAVAARYGAAAPGASRAGAVDPAAGGAQGFPMQGNIRSGISGWRYAGWRRTFYPPGLAQHRELAFAAERTDAIEINGSFYSLQR